MINHILKASLEQGAVISIIYAKDDVITKRNIKVLEINENSIKAYCYLRNQTRVFRLDNILAADYCKDRILNSPY
jgi:predicted DNA-binding transcriptional regulator YafY